MKISFADNSLLSLAAKCFCLAALILSVAVTAEAGQLEITSLPISIRPSDHSSDAVDTITLVGTKLSSATDGIRFNPVSGSPIVGWYVNLGTDTLEFGTGDGSGNEGIFLASLSNQPAHDVTIEGGWIIHTPSTHSDTSISRNTCLYFGADDLLIKDVNMIAGGYNGKCIVGSGTQIEIDGGTYTSNVDYFRSRCQYDALMIGLDGDWDPAYAAARGYTFNVRIHNIRAYNSPHAIIRVGPRDRDLYMVAQIYACSLEVDSRNYLYSPGSGTCASSANPYAISLSRIGPGSRIHDNVITSGSTYAGGRGILIEHARGTDLEYVQVYRNTLDVHEGPNAEYGDSQMKTPALRIRYGSHHLRVHNNTLIATGDNNLATSAYSPTVTALWYSAGETDGVTETYNIIESNLFRSHAGGPGGTAYGITFDEMMIRDSTLLFRNNRIESNNIVVKYGEINYGGQGVTMIGDTLNLYSPAYNPQTFVVGHLCNNWDCSENYVRDAYYEGAASDADINFTCGNNGTLELGLQRSLAVRVLDTSQVPISGALVTVINGYGQQVLSELTDGTGLASGPVVYHWESRSGDSTSFNDFTVKVKKLTDSAQTTHTVTATSAGPIIQLQNTLGDGTVDNSAPGGVGDLSVIPGTSGGEFILSWTAPGDDGYVGQAYQYDLRYDTVPIATWTAATPVYGVPPPRPAGSGELFTAVGLPSRTAFYFAIKSSDEVLNWSPPSNVVLAIPAPEIIATETGTLEATLSCGTIDFREALTYEFQLDTQPSYATARDISGSVTGGVASARYDQLSDIEVYYWHCRAVPSDPDDASPYTATIAFDLINGVLGQAPSTPVAYSPVSNDTVTTLTPTLTVLNSTDPDLDPLTYQFELRNASGSSVLASVSNYDEGAGTTGWPVPEGILANDLSYQWRCRAYDGRLYSDWMALTPFTVLPLVTGVQSEVTLVKAYPNPVSFGGGQLVTFTLGDEPVDLIIQTVSGDPVLIRLGISGDWQWDGTNASGNRVAIGIYLWALTGGQASGKIVVKP